jgi:hypothetical protein
VSAVEPVTVAVAISCPKCGTTDWTVQWRHQETWYGQHIGTVRGDHLYHRCTFCGYAKVSQPLDAASQNDPSPPSEP